MLAQTCKHTWIDFHPYGEDTRCCHGSVYKDSLCKPHYMQEHYQKLSRKCDRCLRNVQEGEQEILRYVQHKRVTVRGAYIEHKKITLKMIETLQKKLCTLKAKWDVATNERHAFAEKMRKEGVPFGD